MKRAAAIVGPTPAFVRWTIHHPCPFRDLESGDPTYQTFRQLRSLREVSTCLANGRVVDGFCLHQEFHQQTETARGFPIDEVLPFFGTRESVSKQCGSCPANAAQHQTSEQDSVTGWAGCYGWFRSFENELDLVASFDDAADRLNLEWKGCGAAKSTWHRVWTTKRWTEDLLNQLGCLVDEVVKATTTGFDFRNFQRAVRACIEHRLPLITELTPAGISDGNAWRIQAHCQDCRFELPGGVECKCPECGRFGYPVEERKRKVLGLRPYMLLSQIIGIDNTATLLDIYAKQRDG